MRRRHVLALCGTAFLAGCGGDGDQGTPTVDDTETDRPTTDEPDDGPDTPTPEGIADRTGQDADVGGTGDFHSTVVYNSCTEVTITADRPYSAVAIGLADGTNEMHQEGYEGTTTFEADVTIREVLIWAEGGGKSNKLNPDEDACPTPD